MQKTGKRSNFIRMTIVALAVFAHTASAQVTRDYRYTTNSQGFIEIEAYLGSNAIVHVPAMLEGRFVVAINDDAFRMNTTLQHVVVTNDPSMGLNVFYGCSGLQTAEIRSVTTISSGMFQNCEKMERVTLSDDLNSIGQWAFSGCTNLNNLTLSSNIQTIRNGAFYQCASIEHLDIPGSLTQIESQTFDGCRRLSSVSLHEGIKSIGMDAFQNCAALTSVSLPSSLTNLESSAFANCDRLYSIDIPSSLTNIAQSLFAHCGSLTNIIVPESVQLIGLQAFMNCSNLASVYFAGNAPVAWNDTFYGVDNATAFYRSSMTGWSNTYAGIPTAEWTSYPDPMDQTAAAFAVVPQTNTFTVSAGSSPSPFSIILTNSGQRGASFSNTVHYDAASLADWLFCTSTSDWIDAQSTVTLNLSITSSTMQAGTYVATNMIMSPDATNIAAHVVLLTITNHQSQYQVPVPKSCRLIVQPEQIFTNQLTLSNADQVRPPVTYALPASPSSGSAQLSTNGLLVYTAAPAITNFSFKFTATSLDGTGTGTVYVSDSSGSIGGSLYLLLNEH